MARKHFSCESRARSIAKTKTRRVESRFLVTPVTGPHTLVYIRLSHFGSHFPYGPIFSARIMFCCPRWWSGYFGSHSSRGSHISTALGVFQPGSKTRVPYWVPLGSITGIRCTPVMRRITIRASYGRGGCTVAWLLWGIDLLLPRSCCGATADADQRRWLISSPARPSRSHCEPDERDQ